MLDVSNTEITNAGLAQLGSLPTLRRLNVRHINVAKDGICELKRELPQCSINSTSDIVDIGSMARQSLWIQPEPADDTR